MDTPRATNPLPPLIEFKSGNPSIGLRAVPNRLIKAGRIRLSRPAFLRSRRVGRPIQRGVTSQDEMGSHKAAPHPGEHPL